MRFLYLVVDDLGADETEMTRLAERGRALVGPDDVFDVTKIRIGPGYFYESVVGGALVVPGVLHAVSRHGADYDAIILGCATDPGLDAARSVTDCAVIGGGEASVVLSALVGRTFGVVTIAESAIPELRAQIRRVGAESRCVGVESIETPFADVDRKYEQALEAVTQQAVALRYRGAESIVLSCMSFGFTAMAKDVSALIGIPVIDPVRAAVAAGRAQATIGARVSRQAVPRLENPGFLHDYLDRLAQLSLDSGLTGYAPDLPETETETMPAQSRKDRHA
ncbi:aspartate/glutamate racemase family protein [Streptomyces sp. NPDC001663]|uniref:aspartate/glutamate racemase family protein n=1 Tax=Streptomyces sp. NPDC001663 TaxID=3364597 RepID=UPI0036952D4E